MKTFLKLIRYTVDALGVIFAVLLILIAGRGGFFEVEPHQQAIVLQFGEPQRLVRPGLHWKIPFIEDVYYCDMLNRNLELTDVEAQMSDLTRISIDASVSYAIADCLLFFMSAHSPEVLRTRLTETLKSALRETVGRYSFPDLSDKRRKILADVDAQMNAAMRSSGVKLMDVNLLFSKP